VDKTGSWDKADAGDSGQGSMNFMKGASRQGKSGFLLSFLLTHEIPNTTDLLTVVMALTDSTQTFMIKTVSKVSSSQATQIYLETVN